MSNSTDIKPGDIVIGTRAFGTSKRRQRITVRVVEHDLGIVVGDIMGADGGAYEGDFLGTASLNIDGLKVQGA